MQAKLTWLWILQLKRHARQERKCGYQRNCSLLLILCGSPSLKYAGFMFLRTVFGRSIDGLCQEHRL